MFTNNLFNFNCNHSTSLRFYLFDLHVTCMPFTCSLDEQGGRREWVSEWESERASERREKEGVIITYSENRVYICIYYLILLVFIRIYTLFRLYSLLKDVRLLYSRFLSFLHPFLAFPLRHTRACTHAHVLASSTNQCSSFSCNMLPVRACTVRSYPIAVVQVCSPAFSTIELVGEMWTLNYNTTVCHSKFGQSSNYILIADTISCLCTWASVREQIARNPPLPTSCGRSGLRAATVCRLARGPFDEPCVPPPLRWSRVLE